jgi:hypothetical protein
MKYSFFCFSKAYMQDGEIQILFYCAVIRNWWDQGISVSIVTRLWNGKSGFNSWQKQRFFSSPPHPDQLPIQWVLGAFALGVKWPEDEADHSPPSNVKVKNVWNYTSNLPVW